MSIGDRSTKAALLAVGVGALYADHYLVPNRVRNLPRLPTNVNRAAFLAMDRKYPSIPLPLPSNLRNLTFAQAGQQLRAERVRIIGLRGSVPAYRIRKRKRGDEPMSSRKRRRKSPGKKRSQAIVSRAAEVSVLTQTITNQYAASDMKANVNFLHLTHIAQGSDIDDRRGNNIHVTGIYARLRLHKSIVVSGGDHSVFRVMVLGLRGPFKTGDPEPFVAPFDIASTDVVEPKYWTVYHDRIYHMHGLALDHTSVLYKDLQIKLNFKSKKNPAGQLHRFGGPLVTDHVSCNSLWMCVIGDFTHMSTNAGKIASLTAKTYWVDM